MARKYLSLQQASGQPVEELLQLKDHEPQQRLLPDVPAANEQRYQFLWIDTTIFVMFCAKKKSRAGCSVAITYRGIPAGTAIVSFSKTCTILVRHTI
jgi:hypothetical protein